MNRIDRIAAILIQLQSKRIVKGQDIADRFQISLRTVYRDIKTLEEAGVPILAEPGSGYSIMEGYRLPPIMFTQEEATAFLTAEKLMEQFTDTSSFTQFQTAMYKIKAVLRGDDKDHLEELQESVAIVPNPFLPEPKRENNFMPRILQAMASKHTLQLSYFAQHSQTQTQRCVEPIGVVMMSNHWYLIAYCTLRNDYRHFKLDRIRQLNEMSQSFSKKHPPLHKFIKEMKNADRELQEVILRCDKEILRYLGDQKYYCGFISEKEVGDQIEMTFLTASTEGLLRWYLMMSDHAEIVSPKFLKEKARSVLKQGLLRLQ